VEALHILGSVGASLAATLNTKDIVSDFYIKDPTDPQCKDDPGCRQWTAFMDKSYPAGDKSNGFNALARQTR
jgi:branched-chain amino acid transport system substrate-binding protein